MKVTENRIVLIAISSIQGESAGLRRERSRRKREADLLSLLGGEPEASGL